jgi:hypothetical protein
MIFMKESMTIISKADSVIFSKNSKIHDFKTKT